MPAPHDAFVPILWDVVAEHLDEAGWLFERRERGLLSVDRTLSDVEEGEERRLLAHLDALVVGGEAVAGEILVPALGGSEPRAACAAAWALLSDRGRDAVPLVVDALVAAPEDAAAAIRRAVELSDREGIDAELTARVQSAPAEAKRRLLEALAARGAPTGAALQRLQSGGDPLLLAAAVRASRFAAAPVADAYVRAGLVAEPAEVREAALETGMSLGRRVAWAEARRLVEAGEAGRTAMFAVALGGDLDDLDLLLRLAADPSRRAEALWAAGFSGRPAAAAAMASLCEGVERVAAEAFLMVTGCPYGPMVIQETASAEGAAEEPEGRDPSRLPGPGWAESEVEWDVLERWWGDHARLFDPGTRYRRGSPYEPEVLLAELGAAPARTMPALALELSARTRGALRVDTSALVSRQRRQIAAAAGALPPGALARPFSKVFE